MVLIPSEKSVEMLRVEVLPLAELIRFLIDKYKSANLSQSEKDFWFKRIEALHAVAASDGELIELANSLDAAFVASSTESPGTDLRAH